MVARQVDHVEEFIEAVTRQLTHDPGGEDYVSFERGDGRRLPRVATFYSELLLPHLEEVASYASNNASPPDELERQHEQIQQQRAQRVEAHLRERRTEIEAYVEGA